MTEFWRDTLSQAEKGVYDALRSAAANGKPIAAARALPDPGMLKKVFACVGNDHPEIFNLAQSFGVSVQLLKVVLRLSYIYDRATVGKINAYLREYSRRTVKESPATEIEKEFKTVDMLVREVDYAINNLTNQNAVSALYFKSAQCSGIARAFKYTMDLLGVWCIVLEGEVLDPKSGRREPHAWNMVRIDGTYYYVDVTMMMGANTEKKEPFYYHRINCSEKTLSENGYTWDKSLLPKCERDMKPSEMPRRTNTASGASVPPRSTATSRATGGASSVRCFTRLYDVKNHIRESLENGVTTVEFALDIPQYDQQKLFSMVGDLLKKQTGELNIRSQFRLQMTGNTVKIETVK